MRPAKQFCRISPARTWRFSRGNQGCSWKFARTFFLLFVLPQKVTGSKLKLVTVVTCRAAACMWVLAETKKQGTRWCPKTIANVVYCLQYRDYGGYIFIVNGDYKPTCNWGAPPCSDVRTWSDVLKRHASSDRRHFFLEVDGCGGACSYGLYTVVQWEEP